MSTFDPAEARRQRGLALAALCKISQKRGEWTVPSQTGNGAYKVVPDRDAPHCDCPDFQERGQPCKHVFAVLFVIEREAKGDGFVSGDQAVDLAPKARAKRPTYRQDWPAYNAAQTTEKARFQSLLFGLCRGIPEPPRKPGRGRKPIPLADAVFASVFKVYSTVSARRFMGDLEDAHAKGYISKIPHFNAIPHTLEMPEVTPILKALIVQSSLPLKAVETDFAIDSSGFATSRFVRWFDHKYGKPMQEYDWVKCHLMAGVKTNIVVSVEIEGRYAADCPQFVPLLNATARNFTVREVSADSAYLSYDNMEAVAAVGGTPYIAFKSNTTAVGGGVMEKMFHFYGLHREEFLSHYHKRSNVESTFSMIKGKFGDHLRSKTDVALVNEALSKVLCHNLCCLILSTYELGITPVFWRDAEKEAIPATTAERNSDVDEMMLMFAWV
jgi:transposase